MNIYQIYNSWDVFYNKATKLFNPSRKIANFPLSLLDATLTEVWGSTSTKQLFDNSIEIENINFEDMTEFWWLIIILYCPEQDITLLQEKEWWYHNWND